MVDFHLLVALWPLASFHPYIPSFMLLALPVKFIVGIAFELFPARYFLPQYHAYILRLPLLQISENHISICLTLSLVSRAY